MKKRAPTLLLGLAWALLHPGLALAQRSALDDVEERAAEARLDEARLTLELWFETNGEIRSVDMERALWLRARLTVDPDLAASDYRRIVLEYPSGTYAARARLRLDQLAEARGERVDREDVLFALELGSTDSYARAARLFDRALRAGLTPRLVRLDSDGDDRYRIRVGRFRRRADAERSARRVERLDFDVRVTEDARSETIVRRRDAP